MSAEDSPLLSGMATLTTQPNTPEERGMAALTVVNRAHDADDCALLLEILGLTTEEDRGTSEI